jgi:hypothetical protein
MDKDRRREVRVPGGGRVRLSFDNPVPMVVDAELIESSLSGFRASHDSKFLDSGTEIRFERAGQSGRARVVWTHILNERRVSGFLILS